ncbi:short-chain fatty acid transporter [Alkalihalobacterium alkalinitrilicum]|uniref:short-chain fatty acid transporter n=1 Tax=Alkalihalobacterium alkalinitrilicum TaxID=427920 RepID=UPI001C574371|nr:TIGR00366 family protein [Alkalihalobacterium alkalinitrilicum]
MNEKGELTLERLTTFFTKIMHRYLPEPFTIAIVLTIVTVVLAMGIQGTGFIETTVYWGNGFWDLLTFTMQMSVILLTGYVLAKTPIVDRLLNKAIAPIKTPAMAIIMATLIAGIGTFINWGFGLVIGAIVARKIALHVKGVHYPLIIAAAYSGFVLYGSGISGSVPITISTPGHFLEEQMGVIPLSETIFSLPMMLTTLAILITLPIFNVLIHPKRKEDIIEIAQPDVQVHEQSEIAATTVEEDTFASKMNNSKILGIGIGVLGLIYTVSYFSTGNSLNINSLNFIMLFLGMLLMGTPARYFNSLLEGIKSIAGLVIQFPFYAGIIGILAGTGLGTTIAQWFVTISTPESLPFWSLISAYFVNLLAPSGGGQWAIQGPVMIEAAKELGASTIKTAMSVQLGDAWNNMIQPFLLLPVLAIAGLKLKDIMGYLVMIMFWIGIVFCTAILLWGYLG